MSNEKRNLKISSLCILALAVVSLVKIIIDACVKGFDIVKEELPEGVTEEVAKASAIVGLVLAVLLLFPRVYIAFKGISISNSDEHVSTKGHFVIGVILAIVNVFTVISGISTMAKDFDASTLLSIISQACGLIVLISYCYYARKVARAGK